MIDFPLEISSLIQELKSSFSVHSVLKKYETLQNDPILQDLFLIFSQLEDKSLTSSTALSIISDSITSKLSLNELLLKPTQTSQPQPFFTKSSKKSLKPQEFCFFKETTDPNLKTLKNLSLEVKKVLISLKTCTYQQVADQILQTSSVQNEKNVRRRVYDVINVFTALDQFEKNGKVITLKDESQELSKRVEKKRKGLKNLVKTFEQLSSLLKRNKSYPNLRQSITLPFYLVSCKKPIQTILSSRFLQLRSTQRLFLLSSSELLPSLPDPENSSVCLPKALKELLVK